MYKDHVIKAVIIVFSIILSFILPLIFLKIFYGNHFTFEFGNMFSKIITYVKYKYYGYVYISKTKHSGAMLGIYFYLVSTLFLLTLSIILIKAMLSDEKNNITEYYIDTNKKEKLALHSLDDKKRL
jgi:Na+(H+)/acetate symporter ActP